MDYWISTKKVQTGPYSWEQLDLMWKQGQVTSDTFYYDGIRKEWLLLKTLIENKGELFTVEEAFVRLGQNRQTGCLLVFNRQESLQVFVEDGFVVHATSKRDQGEFTLSRALHLEEASYAWYLNSRPPEKNLRLNIAEYALKNSIARDISVGAPSPPKRKSNTIALPAHLFQKAQVKLNFNYILVPKEDPTKTLRLVTMTSVVGREDHCDLVINSLQVSRKHCLLEVADKFLKVKDLDSSNGTFVNGLPIKDGFLNVGDEIKLGSYALILQKEQKKAPEMPA